MDHKSNFIVSACPYRVISPMKRLALWKEGKMNIINKTINQLVHEVREVHTNPMNFTIKQYGKN